RRGKQDRGRSRAGLPALPDNIGCAARESRHQQRKQDQDQRVKANVCVFHARQYVITQYQRRPPRSPLRPPRPPLLPLSAAWACSSVQFSSTARRLNRTLLPSTPVTMTITSSPILNSFSIRSIR